ncbi:hypothetical protein RchiOBHm_Chr7g0238591 [Rosa chinensis]|uniref:Uncharacterized protein n=1 Tax=Rosa chinensis TaxID=74649 RepID=A0A2P6PHH3_ROSCH|nr:hypothetical protein RchiOBHm_Chr7g0238591 [Rosa chinensis]
MDEVINPHKSNAFMSVSDCVLISRSHRFKATKLPAISAPSSSHRLNSSFCDSLKRIKEGLHWRLL